MLSQDQWQQKKQTKQEAKAAKRAKLDPDNAKSVKDVMDENARKRKREEAGELSEVEGIELEKPKEGLKPFKGQGKKQKKEERKAQGDPNLPESVDQQADIDPARARAEKRKEKRQEKRQLKKAREGVKVAKVQAKKARRVQETALAEDANADPPMGGAGDSGVETDTSAVDLDPIDITGMTDPIEVALESSSTATPSPIPRSPVSDLPRGQSGTSSISSVAPLTTAPSEEKSEKRARILPRCTTNPEELRARLQQRIEALRAARKADADDGTPARNRQELMEARRRKEDQRKAHKKEVRLKAKEEELRQRDLALSRGSPLLSPAVMSPASGSNPNPSPLREHTESANHFSFGRIAFENGQTMTANLNTVLDPHRRRGPQDPQTALQAANNRAERLAGLDATKRADIEEKDVWLNATKRAHGEKIRDDSSLLKKTLKRKEKAKKKSEKEWGERIEGVEKGKAMKQKKREENLQKRKDGKGVKGKKSKGGAKKGKPKIKARPGFEGSFRAKVGGGAGKAK